MALGAPRGRLIRSLALEALAIALAGGAAGLLLAAAGRRLVPRLLAGELPRLDQVSVNGQVVLFALGASLLAALAAGLLPAVLASDVSLRGVLDRAGEPAAGSRPRLGRGSGRGFSRGFGRISGRRLSGGGLLVIAEVALTMTLTSSAALLVASWLRLSAVDPGFEARGVLVQEVHLPDWRYPSPTERRQAAERILARLRALPGVRGAALTSRLPVAGPAEVWGYRIAGRDTPGGDWTRGRSATMQVVTPGYFRLLGIPLVAGRPLEPGGAGRIVLINRSLAEHDWPGGSAVGARLIMKGETYTVAGVVEDVRTQRLAEEPGDLLIQPWGQQPAASFAAVVRVADNPPRPLDRAADVRRAVHAIDPDLALPPAAALEDRVAGALAGPRSRASFVALSAGVALLLAVVGVYGVVAYAAASRRREIGIRMALGSDGGRVRRRVLAGALGPMAVGVVLGAAGALAAGRLLGHLLFGVEPSAPLLVAGVALALLAACAGAAYAPALRASRDDPARVLGRD
jgi:predicted permease